MKKSLPLTLYPDPLLRKKAEALDLSRLSVLQDFIDDMIVTMHQEDGVGLAAPQVGRSIRLIVVSHKNGPLVLVNPVLSKLSFKKELLEEGCLSIPKVYGEVKRSLRLTYSAHDRNGNPISGEATGFFARILQHEVDHIDGILFIDRAKKITKGQLPEA